MHHFIIIWDIQTGITVRKRLSWAVTSVTLTFELWPWSFAWTSLLSLVITPENFMMIRWWEHSQKGVTDRQTDGRTDGLNHSYSCLVAAKNVTPATTINMFTFQSYIQSYIDDWYFTLCNTPMVTLIVSLGPFYKHRLTLIPAWISNYIHQ